MNVLVMPGPAEVLIKLGLAFGLSGLIGLEREARHRPAGFRTHVLVCVASCLLMMVSMSLGGQRFDPARLAAQVVTGIGFLGAGTIMRHGDIVRGLTTAASIWAVAAIGLAVGIGWFGGAVIATVIIGGTLRGLRVLEDRLLPPAGAATVRAEIADQQDRLRTLLEAVEEAGFEVSSVQVEKAQDRLEVTLGVGWRGPAALGEVVGRLLAVEGVRSVQCE